MNDYSSNVVTERWSRSYDIVHNVKVRTYDKAEAIMDEELFAELSATFPRPLIGYLEGIHYQFKPVSWIPAGSVAVPEDNHSGEPAFLIQK